MVDSGLFLSFILAVTVLMLIPGPNVALIVANSVAHGTRYGLATVAGTTAAMILQLGITALGMTELLGAFGTWFEAVRWAGVAYLVYLGVRQSRAAADDLTTVAPQQKSLRAIVLRGFLVSLTNPKILFFYSAFFPQFVTPSGNTGGQLALLAATFLAIAIVIDSAWALLAGRARGLLTQYARTRNRLSGGLLVGAGLALAIAHRK